MQTGHEKAKHALYNIEPQFHKTQCDGLQSDTTCSFINLSLNTF